LNRSAVTKSQTISTHVSSMGSTNSLKLCQLREDRVHNSPPIAPNPADIALMGLVMPLVQGFLLEIATLSPEEQTQRIAKVLAAMPGDAQ
jgi:hypothetical protein